MPTIRTLSLIVAIVSVSFVSIPTIAKEITFGMREVAPYVMKTATGMTGLDYEIIAAALAHRGHQLTVKLYPFARLVTTFNDNREIEAAAPVLASFKVDGTLTDPFITYENIGLSLEQAKLPLTQIADLAQFRIIAFQNAKAALGPEFAAAVAANPGYREEATQQVQIRALFNGRTDLVIGERRILHYFIQDPSTGINPSLVATEHRLFAPTHYSAVFRDPTLAVDFNAGLAAIKASGLYDALLKKYSKLPAS